MGGRARCWQCQSNAAEAKAWLKGKAGLIWASCRQQIHLQPGRLQPGSASSSAAALRRCPKTGRRQHPVPPLLHRPGKGLAGFLGRNCRKGKKNEPAPSPAPVKQALQAGLGQKSRSRSSCLWAGLSTLLPARQGSWDGGKVGKLGWRESTSNTKPVLWCAKRSTPPQSNWDKLRRAQLQ